MSEVLFIHRVDYFYLIFIFQRPLDYNNINAHIIKINLIRPKPTCYISLYMFSQHFPLQNIGVFQCLSSFTFLKSMNKPVPLLLIPGIIYNIPPFVMSQQGRPTWSPGAQPGPYTLSRGRLLLFFCYLHFLIIVLAPNLRFGEKRDRQPRSTSGDRSSPTYTIDYST